MRGETLTLEYWEDEEWFVGHLVECSESSVKGKRWRNWMRTFGTLIV